ncbi:MAG: AtpZ/AtpI family protein [Alphaproteobacteria bacterium]|nr:AtpZ/AtpI family protein [Alphaproteobacteria bacterium]
MKTDLDKKIRAFEKVRADDKAPMFGKRTSSGAGRAGYEFIIATLFFAGIGFLIDIQLDTKPWITLGMFFLGFITGAYNAWRSLNVDSETVGAKYKSAPKVALDAHDIELPHARRNDHDHPL